MENPETFSFSFPSSMLFCIFLLATSTMAASAADTINTTQSIRDGETIVSAGGRFELGFFNLGSSSKRYLGILYKQVTVQTVVWVANREVPLNDSNGVLKLSNQGILVLSGGNGSTVWSSNASRPTAGNPVAQLLDSGNFVVKDGSDFLWQSFDYPGDTSLPGMKIGRNLKTGLDRYLSSWKSPEDPSPGNFTYRFDLGGYPEWVLRDGSTVRFRSGPWNGLRFSGLPELRPNPIFTYEFVFNEEEVYFTSDLVNKSVLSRTMLSISGNIERFTYIEETKNWVLNVPPQQDNCDQYAICGGYGICNNNNSRFCGCLRGFVPKNQNEWDMGYRSNGCVRKTPLNCSSDGFVKHPGVKLPETRHSWFNKSMTLEECRSVCLKNCSCTAYTSLDIRRGGSGCLLWSVDLIDMRQFAENGQDIYVRMAASDLDQTESNRPAKSKKKRVAIIVSSVFSAGLLIVASALILYIWRKRHHKNGLLLCVSASNEKQEEDFELPLFDLATITSATNNFPVENILGEGGYGPVYKGILKDGQEIAVKRLSKDSTQGLIEFKNEVIHIAKLQHRNLVKLLGCCIQSDEKMLIYEFMPNKSLDFIIFDKAQRVLLQWPVRYNIINGIARGLLYLHQDSRQRIIHRDLKASNILLDNEMNPKISDFGLARSFGEHETKANTKRVVGTYGYMSPEYAIDGLYSTKSDVFSFGVLVLEIVSGKKNRGFCHPDHHLNLLGHAWRLHNEGKLLDLVPPSLRESCNLNEVLRSIHVGLLCVQRSPEDRPTMSAVVLMLGGEGPLPRPKQPGFFTERDVVESSSSSSNFKPTSNEFTITLLHAR